MPISYGGWWLLCKNDLGVVNKMKSYEAWRVTFQSSEQAAKSAFEQLIALTEKTQWINVNERWPERVEGMTILGWNGDYVFQCECDQDGDWCSIGGDEFTHWKPLDRPV